MSQSQQTSDTAAMWVWVATYVSGGEAAEEHAEVARWIAAKPGRAAALEQLREAWTKSHGRDASSARSSAVSIDMIAGWEALKRRIDVTASLNDDSGSVAAIPRHISLPERRTLQTQTAGLRTQILRHWSLADAPLVSGWRWIAGAAGSLVAILLIFLTLHGSARGPGMTREYTTAVGQQKIITLDDGTRVILAPKTTLKLSHFGASSRTVILENGEAYFTVTHASRIPFLVQSGNLTVHVLGTEFLVQRGHGDKRVRVAVANGKVGVTSSTYPDSTITLTAGQIGDVTDSTARVTALNAAATDMEWMSGHLLFRHTQVSIILQTLSRWYGYQFRLADPTLAQQRLTIGISTQSSAEALAAIELVLAVNLTVAGDTVILTPQQLQLPGNVPRTRNYNVWTPMREAGR